MSYLFRRRGRATGASTSLLLSAALLLITSGGRDVYLKFYETAITNYPVPYFPNATINWDDSPRAASEAKWDRPAAHVVNPVMVGNSPAAFREACQILKNRLLAAPTMPKIITVNAWNEWPEGSVLEPNV
jgi:hypothetical protein